MDRSQVLQSFLLLVSLVSSYGQGNRHEGHTHYIPNIDGSRNVLKDKDFIRDYEHIKEDIQDLYNMDFSETPNAMDMEVYYFQIHDFDQNGKLDGLELLSAFQHVRTRNEDEEIPVDYFKDGRTYAQGVQDYWNEKFEKEAALIDEVMQEDDLDHDGYLSYLEYVRGREREENM